MKKILLALLIFPSFVFGQSLNLDVQSNYVFGEATDGNVLKAYITVNNTSTRNINVIASREEISLVSGTQNYFCWGINCYPPNVSISLFGEPIASNTNNTSFYGDYEPKGNPGISYIKYCFYDESNPTDSACALITYDASPLSISENKDVQSFKISPNPAKSLMTLSFESNTTNNEVVFYNIMGQIVKSVKLNGRLGSEIIGLDDIQNGVYFVTLQSNGKSLKTQRLIVSK